MSALNNLVMEAYKAAADKSHTEWNKFIELRRKQVDKYIGNNIYRKVMYKFSKKYRLKVISIVNNLNHTGEMVTFHIYKGETNE